jgi:hypothetical protein
MRLGHYEPAWLAVHDRWDEIRLGPRSLRPSQSFTWHDPNPSAMSPRRSFVGTTLKTIGPSRVVEINGHRAGVYVKTMGQPRSARVAQARWWGQAANAR